MNQSILAIIIVHTWFLYKGVLGEGCEETQAEFYDLLSEEMIVNSLNDPPSSLKRGQRQPEFGSPRSLVRVNGQLASGMEVRLTPTKKRRTKNGTLTPYLRQNDCRMCKKRTTHICSQCRDESPNETEIYLCHAKSGRSCFKLHCDDHHYTEH